MRFSISALVLTLAFFSVVPANATIKIALRNGGSCSTCHVNPSGGGLRNEYGFDEIMLRDLPRPRPPAPDHLSTRIGSRLRWGADLRIQGMRFDSLTVYPTDSDTVTRSPSLAIFPMQAALYLNARASERFDVYLAHYLLQPTTEYWLRYSDPLERLYIRMGRFLPAYGLRLDDHTAFIRGGHVSKGRVPVNSLIRQGLPFGPYAHGNGSIEAGTYFGTAHISGHLSTPSFAIPTKQARKLSEMQYGGRIEWQPYIASMTHMFVVSYLQEGDLNLTGLSYGVDLGPIIGLAEIDWATDWARPFGTLEDDIPISKSIYGEIDYQLAQGANLFVRYGQFVQNVDQDSGLIDRIVIGAEYFPVPFLEVKYQLRLDGSEYHQKRTLNGVLQLHAYF